MHDPMPVSLLARRLALVPDGAWLLAALPLGALSSLGFEPWGLTAPALAALLALLLALMARPARATPFAFLFFATHFAVSLAWIASAFTFQSNMPAAFGWLAVAGLSLFLALYPALAAWGAARLARRPLGFAPVFAGLFATAEMARGLLFTGFSWNPLGALLLGSGDLARLAAVTGASGLSALLLAGLGGLAAVLLGDRRGGWLAAGLALLLVAGPMLLPAAPPAAPDAPRILIVQPGTGIADKHSDGGAERSLEAAISLTRRALDRLAAPPAAIVWPEATVEFPLEESLALRLRLVDGLPPDTLLLTGGVALERNGAGRVIGARNSLYALDSSGAILARYDKAHLVPGGEYLPLRPIAEPLGLARLVPGSLDFLPGPGPVTWRLPGLPPLSPNICYEIIFPAAVVDRADRPAFLVTVSNDAWFGPTGPPQHHAQARLRAIEEGIPIVRVTPTGVSGLIGADGARLETLLVGDPATALVALPPPLTPTPAARLGLGLPLLVAGLLLAAGLAANRIKT
ncbi:MAG: apolipoprotein N-acyltransferase [Sphingomonadaceae bacterium]